MLDIIRTVNPASQGPCGHMSRNKAKKIKRKRNASIASQDQAFIAQHFRHGGGVTSKHDARNKHRAAVRAIHDRQRYGTGISEFITARHEGEGCLMIRGRALVRRKPGRFNADKSASLLIESVN